MSVIREKRGKVVNTITGDLKILSQGSKDAPVLVICEPPSARSYADGKVMSDGCMQLFLQTARENGFKPNEFAFVTCSPPMPELAEGSAKRENLFLDQWRAKLIRRCNKFHPKVTLFMGANAGRQLTGKPCKITKVRGMLNDKISELDSPCYGMLSPGMILRQPKNKLQFRADFAYFGRIKDEDYDFESAALSRTVDYRWVNDQELMHWIDQELVKADLKGLDIGLSLDSETRGGKWNEGCVPICFQMSTEPGISKVICVDPVYAVKWGLCSARQADRNFNAVKKIIEEYPIQMSGHNLKYDIHVMLNVGIKVPLDRWAHDTMQLAFCYDENILSKDLANMTSMIVPEMAGYSQEFDAETDKSQMLEVPPERMLPYAGGDTDAVARMTRRLARSVGYDKKQWECYQQIQMPALRMFVGVERQGIRINKKAVRRLSKAITKTQNALYDELISGVPRKIRQMHADVKGKDGLKFSRRDFVKDILFHKHGFNLKPVVFTKSTRKLAVADRVPSTSGKDHLPFFSDDNPWVAQLMEYQKIATLNGNFVGKEFDEKKNAASGIWKYIGADGRIHSSFYLHRTVTGRTASADPNGQNFPKRGELAKAYREIFVPTKGYYFIECDLSQAELRMAAWHAMESRMLALYKVGVDLHTATAAAIKGLSLEAFNKLPDAERAKWRQRAKAVNFGFLYGMGWRKFRSYAKTDYQLDVTEQEAQDMRHRFFNQYPELENWHKAIREFVKSNGYVRAKHGAKRFLPDVYSVDEMIRSSAERQAINSPIQRIASDLGLIGATMFNRDCDPNIARVVAFIHDAVILEVKIGHEQSIMSAIKWYMQNQPIKEMFGVACPIPVIADVSIGRSLGKMNEDKDVKAKRPKWFGSNQNDGLALAS